MELSQQILPIFLGQNDVYGWAYQQVCVEIEPSRFLILFSCSRAIISCKMRVYPGIVSEDGGVRKPSVVHFETLQPLENAGCSANLIVGVRASGCAQHSELLDPRSVGTRALGPFGPCIGQRVYRWTS